MADVLANMAVFIGANTSQFESALAKTATQLDKVGKQAQKVGESLSKYVTLPLLALGGASLKVFGDVEALKKGLEAVTGSSEEAAKQFTRLKEVAKLPGLGFEEAIQGSINLQAAGFNADLAERALKGFGNALATVGKGKADLDGVNTALSQMAAKGKISAEEINQIAERVPQIRKVMQKAFGTSNTEELQKMGIDATTFVDKVVTELEKLPPVAGGLKNSFENLGDSTKVALSGLGETINRVFNVEGIINKAAGAIEAITEKFNNLSPTTQRIIVVLGAFAAAIGPVLLVIGKLISLWPLVIAGFTALKVAILGITGPIGIAIAAIAAGAILIYQNWDKIVSYFTSGAGSGIWEKLQRLVTAVMEAIRIAIDKTVKIGTALWERFGGSIMSVVDLFVTPVVRLFQYAFDQILNILDFFINVFEGNWAGVWESSKIIFKTFHNFMIGSASGLVTGVIGIFAKLADSLGADAIGTALKVASDYITSFSEKLKFDLDSGSVSAQQSFKGIAAEAEKAIEPVQKLSSAVAGIGVARMGNIQAITIPVKFQPIENALTDFPPIDVTPTGLGALLEVNHQLAIAEEKSLAFGSSFDLVAEKTRILQGAMSSLIEQGFTAGSGAIVALQEQMTGLQESFIDITNLVTDSVVSAFELVGETIGRALSGGAGNMEHFLDGFLGIIAGFLGQFGKMLIQAGVAKEIFEKLLVTPGAGFAAIAAGVALVAIAGAIKGNLAKGPTGGGGGYSPPSSGGGSSYSSGSSQRIGGMIDGQGQSIHLTGEIRADGRDLVYVIDQQTNKAGRVGG